MLNVYYLASAFNSAELFQHFGGWLKRNTDQGTNDTDISQFLFRATSAYINIINMYKLEQECLKQYHMQKSTLEFVAAQRMTFWSPTLVELMGEMSPFFSSLRIMQNSILRMAAKERKSNHAIPKSMKDVMKNLDKYDLGEDISDIAKQYWDSSGKLVRAYRNLDQHYYAMIHHTFLQTYPEECVLIFLPDDPLKQGKDDAAFKKEIDAIKYIRSAFSEFHNFADNIASTLGFEPLKLSHEVLFKLEKNPELGYKTIALLLLDINEYGSYSRVEVSYSGTEDKARTSFHKGSLLRPT